MATYNYRKSPSPQNGFYDQHYYEYYNETVDVLQRLPTIEEAREQYEAYNEYSLALSSMPYQDDQYQQYDDYYKHPESRQYHLHMVAILCLTLLTIVGLLFGAYWLLIKEDVFGRTAPP